MNIRHGVQHPTRLHTHWLVWAVSLVCAIGVGCGVAWACITYGHREDRSLVSHGASASATPSVSVSSTSPSFDTSADTSSGMAQDVEQHVRALVEQMSMQDRAAQLVMAPLSAGTDPSSMQSLISDEHIGSVILMGNWMSGTMGVRAVVDELQSYAHSGSLLVSTDQEGGLVQHLQGSGFETMPSEYEQGRMSVEDLRLSSKQWGNQLHEAGITLNLAPCVDTVTIDRMVNEPIGALNRDYGLDAEGNAQHATAFIQGMRDAGIATAVKHYPGLGSVTGNTDFTDTGITDTTTTRTSVEVDAFTQVIRDVQPSLVMMSLASYEQIDPGVPAAFSQTIIKDMLRNDAGYTGVVISDSLSASAVQGYDPQDLGVMFIEAGGDIVCINDPAYTLPILRGIQQRAQEDTTFANQVTEAAVRVLMLKNA